MEVVRILDAGPLATVQDLGRYGFQDRGIPVSGAVDRRALRIGNLLVGNREGDAGVEITLGGFEAKFLSRACFSLTGADMDARLNGSPVSNWRPHDADRGDVLALGYARSGFRSYFTVSGGIDVPLLLGSRSTYLRGGFGGYEGRPLKKGHILRRGVPTGEAVQSFPSRLIPRYEERPVLRVVLGPQEDYFTAEGIAAFLSGAYEITSRSDRMGCVLLGPSITHKSGADIISDGAIFGAIQVPGKGQPTLLLADSQTTGGYAKIAVVLSSDLPQAAQLAPGSSVRFEAVGLLEARNDYLRQEFKLRNFINNAKR